METGGKLYSIKPMVDTDKGASAINDTIAW